jgi:hypothetical protein
MLVLNMPQLLNVLHLIGDPSWLTNLENYGVLSGIIIVVIGTLVGLPLTIGQLQKLHLKPHCLGLKDQAVKKAQLDAEHKLKENSRGINLQVDRDMDINNIIDLSRSPIFGLVSYKAYSLVLMVIRSLQGLIIGVPLSFPAYFVFGGWVFPLGFGILGATGGLLCGNLKVGWILGIFCGLFAWFCGYPVRMGISFTVLTVRGSTALRTSKIMSETNSTLLGALLGIIMGSSILNLLWLILIHGYGRLHYRSDIVHILTLIGSILGMLVGIVANFLTCFPLCSQNRNG